MTVSTELSHEEYTGNGVTTDFDFRFRILKAEHLVVSVADSDGTERILTNGTDYTLRGVGSYRGGKVILKMPLAAGWKIGIARDLPVVQETDLRNQGKFFAEVHEDALDYLTMLIQKSLGYLSLCLRKPSFISDHYDAKGNKISNLGKPVKDGDAVDLGTMKEHISAKDKRSLRVADKDIPALPNAGSRANKLLSFDDNGYPYLVPPADGSASDIWNKMSSWDVTHSAESIALAKKIDVRIGDVIHINDMYFKVSASPSRNSRYPVIKCNNGYYLIFSDLTEIKITGSLIPELFLDFTTQSTYVPGSSGKELPQGLQGVEIDNVNKRAFVIQINHGSSNPETCSIFEYDFSHSQFGNILKESHDHIMGHGDHFAIEVKNDGTRRIWYTRPTNNNGSWSPSTLCVMNWDADNPKETIKEIYSFDFYVGIGWFDSELMYLLTHTNQQYVCNPDDLLSGIFKPVVVINSKDANIALVRNPKQQLKHFLGSYIACSGGDVSNKKEAYVAVGNAGVKTSLMNIYTNEIYINGTSLPWGEIEGLCWLWDDELENIVTLVGVVYPDLSGVWFFNVCSDDSDGLFPVGATEFYQNEITLPLGQDQGGSSSGKVAESSVPVVVPQAFFGGWKVNDIIVGGVGYKINYSYNDFFATQNVENYGTSYALSATLHGFNWDLKMYPVTDNRYGGAFILRSVQYERNAINLTENGCLELNLNYVKGSGYASAFQHNANMMDETPYRAGFHSRASVISFLNENALLTVGRYTGDITFGYVSNYAKGVEQYLFRINANRFEPFADNSKDLGSASTRFRTIYAGTGNINTSDVDHKTLITEIPDSVLDAWSEVEFKQYKFKDAINTKGEKARFHFGVVAQDIISAFEKHGLNPYDYGVLCFDSWEDEYLPDGTKIKEAGSVHGVRYDEAMIIEAALMRREIKRIK